MNIKQVIELVREFQPSESSHGEWGYLVGYIDGGQNAVDDIVEMLEDVAAEAIPDDETAHIHARAAFMASRSARPVPIILYNT